MPGFATHYIFGQDVYHKLPESSMKKNLYRNRAAYGLGLQGPDFFFFFLPSYLLHGKNLGSVTHTTDTQKFFHALFKSRSMFHNIEDRDIADAYLIGFLGHYTLDTTCHPFVYGRTNYPGRQERDYFSRHAYLETDIDIELIEHKLKRSARSFHGENTIALTPHQQWIIAKMLCYAYREAYPKFYVNRFILYFAIYSMQLGLHLLHDSSGQKKVLFRWLEKHLLGHPIFSPLIVNDKLAFRSDPMNKQHKKWTNPWDSTKTSIESFGNLYEKAKARYLRRIQKLSAFLQCETTTDTAKTQMLFEDFFADYGNLSFHSGLDASIPS